METPAGTRSISSGHIQETIANPPAYFPEGIGRLCNGVFLDSATHAPAVHKRLKSPFSPFLILVNYPLKNFLPVHGI
jgi:hypothetical protein